MAQIFITNSSITLGISLQIIFLSWKNMSNQMRIFIGWDLDLLKLFFFFSISNLPKESKILCNCLLLANTSQLNIAGFSIKCCWGICLIPIKIDKDRHQLWSNLPWQTVICSCTKYLCAWSGYHLVLRMILLFVLDVYRLWCFWKQLHQDLNNAETDNNTVNTKHQYCWYQSYAN